MKLIAYTRRSTDKQDLTHDAQLAAVRRARPDDDLMPVEDTCSGGKPLEERDGGKYALAQLDAGRADGIVVARLDRLARSTLDFAATVERAREHGWDIICLDPSVDLSTAGGKLVADVLMAMAEFERSLIRDRTREGLAQSKRNGTRLGAPPVPAAVEMRILREWDAQPVGEHNMSAIARGLNEDSVRTARGGARWRPSNIRAVLVRHSRLD